jgi:hypothetical protein
MGLVRRVGNRGRSIAHGLAGCLAELTRGNLRLSGGLLERFTGVTGTDLVRGPVGGLGRALRRLLRCFLSLIEDSHTRWFSLDRGRGLGPACELAASIAREPPSMAGRACAILCG